MHTAFSDVIEALGEPFLNQGLRREDQMVALKLHLQVVSGCKAELVMKFLGNNHLAGYPDFDSGHGGILLELYFHIIVY